MQINLMIIIIYIIPNPPNAFGMKAGMYLLINIF